MKHKSIFFFILFASMPLVYSQSSFSFHGKEVKPGTKQHFVIPISDNTHSTFIPITIFHGIEDGPVLGITAGVHGYEYPPILAGQKLIKSIVPKSLKGTIILVQMANISSFSGRSPFNNPLDGKNLNRTFPGDEKGTVTERIADFISNKIIARSNFFLDMHAGDAPEDLTSYSAYYANSDMPEVSKLGKEMAQALLFDYIIVFNTDGKDYVKKNKPSLYCSAEAFKRGIPSIDIECGKLGLAKKEDVVKIETGVLNLLKYLKMNRSNSKFVKGDSPLFVTNRHSQNSKYDGIFYPSKTSGDYVLKGMEIGTITDYFGNHLETIHAESDGVILLILGTPPVNKGETLVVIADVKQ